MATSTREMEQVLDAEAVEAQAPAGEFSMAASLWGPVRTLIEPWASLKLTVTLLGMGIFIVLAGTMAQVKADIWQVINEYFRVNPAELTAHGVTWKSFFVWVDFSLFAPPSFFPSATQGAGYLIPHTVMPLLIAVSTCLAALGSWRGFRNERVRFVTTGAIVTAGVALLLVASFSHGIPFPKGWLIGAVMLVNLLSAHFLRFKVQASGTQLVAGGAVLLLGMIVTALVIQSGSSDDGFQAQSLIGWDVLWQLMQLGLLIAAAAAIYGLFSVELWSLRYGLVAAALGLVGVLVWSVVSGPDVRFGDSSMRILYQLIKATLAGVVLLVGCIPIFKKRAGIVVLHGGIGLMMVSEVLVGVQAEEAQMRIEEGRSSNFVEDIRAAELAFVTPGEDGQETHAVVPLPLLRKGERVSDPALPVDIEVIDFQQNARVVRVAEAPSGQSNPATAGVGKHKVAVPVRATSGTDTGGGVDNPALYVRLTDRETGRDLGTWLVSTELDLFHLGEDRQTVRAADCDYALSLRFKRSYRPYTITLNDIRKEDYIGTDTPRDYSSYIHLADPSRGIDREEVRIWMNNPLRYAGETFYQSSYIPANAIYSGSREWTSLQVVKNTGWMIPYVACMIVVVGLVAQFGQVLIRFLRRRERGVPAVPAEFMAASAPSGTDLPKRRKKAEAAMPQEPAWDVQLLNWLVPAVVVALFGGYLLSKARMPSAREGTMDLAAFGEIPIVYEGRPKPIDTLARNSLLILSDRQEVALRLDEAALKKDLSAIKQALRKRWKKLTDADLAGFTGAYSELPGLVETIVAKTGATHAQVDDAVYTATSEEQPAVKWLLDVITDAESSRQHRVFRIENLELLETLGLERRDGFRYSIDEFTERLPKYLEQLREAEKLAQSDKEQLTFYQRKLFDFRTKLQAYQKLRDAYVPPGLPRLPTEQETKDNPEEAKQRLHSVIQVAMEESSRLESSQLPLTIPAPGEGAESNAPTGKWLPFSTAVLRAYLQTQLFGEEAAATTQAFNRVVLAYEQRDARAFNKAVEDYTAALSRERPKGVNTELIHKEVFFNHFAPFYYSAALYIVAFVLTCASWLGFTRPLNWSAFALMVFTLCVHTWGIWTRIEISGRPPVTNLYSSAVFIGWAAVLLGLILEYVYRLGVGNVIAAKAGFITLGIAHFLAGDGDTFTVLQAVLDTQFWLATHVVCITLGYATTYVAGLLGLMYILRGVLTPSLTDSVGKDLTRMTYGTLCFAILFSFFGTVLGGLWADDSWGRFWGWDPKENGALIIVLWNALVLHARWDGQVKDRGLAVLAVLGNIAVSWSWFGVNELGVGLHSYGFTDGVLLALGLFCLSQLVIAAVGCLPKAMWFSHARDTA